MKSFKDHQKGFNPVAKHMKKSGGGAHKRREEKREQNRYRKELRDEMRESSKLNESSYHDTAQKYKQAADEAKSKGDIKSHHLNMSQHHKFMAMHHFHTGHREGPMEYTKHAKAEQEHWKAYTSAK